MINKRLFEQYQINTDKHLNIDTICARPFDTVLIDKNGSCYACECTSWLPQSIGNLQMRSLDSIIGSAMHQHLKGSVSDGSYRYCNENQCPHLRTKVITEIQETYSINLRLAIDDSCNLRCPSCRTGLIFHKQGSRFERGRILADKINKWLETYKEKRIKVHIGSDGDPFASHIYQYLIANTPLREGITYSILTNGLLLDEFYSRLPTFFDKVYRLGVSIDGASRDTYEKLRLGGRWERICENLDLLSKLRREKNFEFCLHMVVQQDNWREMAGMLDMGYRLGADVVYFNKIQDWGTGIDFSKQTFVNDNEFKKMRSRVSKDSLSVTHALF